MDYAGCSVSKLAVYPLYQYGTVGLLAKLLGKDHVNSSRALGDNQVRDVRRFRKTRVGPRMAIRCAIDAAWSEAVSISITARCPRDASLSHGVQGSLSGSLPRPGASPTDAGCELVARS